MYFLYCALSSIVLAIFEIKPNARQNYIFSNRRPSLSICPEYLPRSAGISAYAATTRGGFTTVIMNDERLMRMNQNTVALNSFASQH